MPRIGEILAQRTDRHDSGSPRAATDVLDVGDKVSEVDRAILLQDLQCVFEILLRPGNIASFVQASQAKYEMRAEVSKNAVDGLKGFLAVVVPTVATENDVGFLKKVMSLLGKRIDAGLVGHEFDKLA